MFCKSFAVVCASSERFRPRICRKITAGGVATPGYLPYQDPYMSPKPDRPSARSKETDQSKMSAQPISNVEAGPPVASSVPSQQKAYVTAAAGSEVSLQWTLWPDSHKGPLITYMAKCPNNDCTTYAPGTAAVWFKVHHAGRVGTSNIWASSPLEKDATRTYKYTIPTCLAAGAYIVRHEVLGLHAAFELNKAQFYPSCHQIKVTGGGSSTGPAAKVAFPGAYKNTDAGIQYDMYKATTYTIPGPPVFTC